MMTYDEIETLAAKLLPTDFEKAPMTANELIEAIIGDVDPDDVLTIVKRAANMAESPEREVLTRAIETIDVEVTREKTAMARIGGH